MYQMHMYRINKRNHVACTITSKVLVCTRQGFDNIDTRDIMCELLILSRKREGEMTEEIT